jgi:hypothetical protein
MAEALRCCGNCACGRFCRETLLLWCSVEHRAVEAFDCCEDWEPESVPACPICGFPGRRDRPELRLLDAVCTKCGWYYTSWAQERDHAQRAG